MKFILKTIARFRYFILFVTIVSIMWAAVATSNSENRNAQLDVLASKADSGAWGGTEKPSRESTKLDNLGVETVISIVSVVLSVLGFASQFYFTRRSDLREERKLRLEEDESEK